MRLGSLLKVTEERRTIFEVRLQLLRDLMLKPHLRLSSLNAERRSRESRDQLR